MTLINQFSFAFISTLGFTIIFNIPRKQMVAASLLGSVGWCVYYFYKLSSSPIIAAFWGALIVGFIGEVFARMRKQPATLFIIPGIIPLVPGAGMYYTMYHLVQNDLSKSAQFGIETLMIALSIAIGIILATSVSKAFPRK